MYLAFVDTANSDQVTAVYPSSTRYHAPSNGRSGVFKHQYTWGAIGIEVPPNTDFFIGLAPVNNQGDTVVRTGAQAADSPTESNVDNSDDITFVSPAVRSGFALHVNNTLTRPANGFPIGNFKIYYHTTLTGSYGSTTFTGLTDTPDDITADECVQGNATGDALVFGSCGTGGGGGGGAEVDNFILTFRRDIEEFNRSGGAG